VILDDTKATEIVSRLKARLAKIRSNKYGDSAPHKVQALEGEFYDCIYNFLLSAVSEFAINACEADKYDLAQDSFLKILRNIAAFKPRKGKLHSWMTMIVKNTCIDWARKRRPELMPVEEFYGQAETPAIQQEFDKETFDTLKAFFPFFVSDRMVFELLSLVEKYNFNASISCVKDVVAVLKEAGIDYTEYGKPVTLVQAIIIILRGMLLTPLTDRSEIIEENLKKNPQLDVLRAMTFFFGARTTSQLVLLMGGMQIQLPAPQQFGKLIDETR